jgi:hypothetical protein
MLAAWLENHRNPHIAILALALLDTLADARYIDPLKSRAGVATRSRKNGLTSSQRTLCGISKLKEGRSKAQFSCTSSSAARFQLHVLDDRLSTSLP